jgi:hypothetical protein
MKTPIRNSEPLSDSESEWTPGPPFVDRELHEYDLNVKLTLYPILSLRSKMP